MVVLAVAALLVGVVMAVRLYGQRHVTLRFKAANGPVPALELAFFPQQLAFGAPSPPPPLGELKVEGGSSVSVTVGSDLVPGEGVVRYRGEGVGTGFAFVALGGERTVTLHPPAKYAGRVGRRVKLWFRGWRTVAMRAIADAEVMVMGGGQHGVDLASARTDDNGRFVVEGFDGELDAIGLRVRAPRHAVFDRRLEDVEPGADGKPLIVLDQAPPRRGRVVLALPPGHALRVQQLRVLARGLPGVEATPDAEGNFVLEGVPADVEARLVLFGLPDDCAFPESRTDKRAPVEVRVGPGARIRGRVLRPFDREPVAGALVWIGDFDAVRTDAGGRFELQHVLPGSVELRAQWEPEKKRRQAGIRFGSRQLDVQPGAFAEDIDIVLER